VDDHDKLTILHPRGGSVLPSLGALISQSNIVKILDKNEVTGERQNNEALFGKNLRVNQS
jgi:hypothetical protein